MENKHDHAQPSQVIAVQASAGSGKTYALAKRYLELLLSGRDIPLRNILAITFTNKAAHEMKERILHFLKQVALDAYKNKSQAREFLELSADSHALQARAAASMEEIIKNYNFFQVQTIDSFINSLLFACAFRLRLSSSFQVRKDFNQYLTLSLDELIDEASAQPHIRAMFDNFLKQYLYLENKTSWFPKRDILSIVTSLFGTHNIYAGEFKKFDIEESDIFSKKKIILTRIRQLRRELPDETNKTFVKTLDKFLDETDEFFSLDDIPSGLASGVPPLNKGKDPSVGLDALWKDIRVHIKEACEIESLSMFNCYIDIFSSVHRNFVAISRKNDVLFLEELNRYARTLFGEDPITTPELYYRLAGRLKYFLIDEFQDTSVLQWMNMLVMIEEALSRDGSLFFVGDKKQAIFRFRGGEITLFDTIQAQFRNRLSTQVLANNYRSQKEVVCFNNEIFSRDNILRFISQVNAEEDSVFSGGDTQEIAGIFADSTQTYTESNTQGYVEVSTVEANDTQDAKDIIKTRLVALVKDLVRTSRFTYKDIALIARKNEEVALLSEWLLGVDIPVESEKTLNIRENTLIKEVISFLKFLNSPIDNLFFASFVLGDIFTRASALDRARVEDFIAKLKLREHKRNAPYLYKAFRAQFPDAWSACIDEFFKSVGFVPLYEMVLAIFDRFEVIQNFPDAHGFFMKLLELIKDQEEDYPTLAEFLEYFDQAQEEELYVNVANTDAVKVLTVHKAKGLEFPVVLVPFVEMDVKVGSGAGQGGHTYVIDPSQAGHIRLLKLKKKKYTEFSKVLSGVYENEYKKAFIDELNNIYVAFTRAQYELYLFIPKKVSNKKNHACFLMPQAQLTRGTRARYEPHALKERPVIELVPACRNEWVTLLADEFGPATQITRAHKIHQGKVLHEIFSHIDNLKGRDYKTVFDRALAQARRKFPEINKADAAAIESLLNAPALKPLFWVEEGEVFCEKDFVDHFGNTKRIDRLIVSPAGVTVIDFKSSADERESHIAQVREYIALMQEVYKGSTVKGCLVYFDTTCLEEVKG
ncbi:MAG: UvrD-helicase domain-containing protein [Candidatus Omnitrophota bacterium]